MSGRWWGLARLLAGAAILAALVWRLGTGPVLDGLRRVDVPSLFIASGLVLIATVSCAWRWSAVARGLGVDVPLRAAVPAYYRSQFLNTTLPGGILGDVHRGVRHGRDAGDVGRGLRAVAWERSAGQVVQLVLSMIVLVVLPSPLRSWLPGVAAASAVVLLVAALLLRRVPAAGSSRPARALRATRADVCQGLLARRCWPAVVTGSTVSVSAHAAIFVVAARTAGVTAPLLELLPLAVVVLLAMSVPTNIGGWGPRESAAAWLFAAAGLGADQGLATATVYGVLAFAAALPGAVVLVVARRRGRPQPPAPAPAPRIPVLAHSGGVVRD